MEFLLNTAVIWFVIGLALFLLEFVLPGFILFFFGVGAWVVAMAVFFFDLSLNAQLLLFIVSSLISVLLLRNWLKRKFGDSDVNLSKLEDEFVGKIAIAETSIGPGMNGKVEFKGTSWEATSDDAIAIGESVMITATRSIILVVKSIK